MLPVLIMLGLISTILLSVQTLQPPLVAALVMLILVLGILVAIPTRMILQKTPNYELDGWFAVPLGAAFPVWGGLLALLSMGLLAPLTCSAVWCTALGACLGARRAVQLWIVIAFVPLLAGLAGGIAWQTIGLPAMLGFGGTAIVAWLVVHPMALGVAVELRRLDIGAAKNRCPSCGYARDGLPLGVRCPECGI